MGIIESIPFCEPHKVQKIRKQAMNIPESLKHSKWECRLQTVKLNSIIYIFANVDSVLIYSILLALDLPFHLC